jgi:hypothetical protein
MRQRLLAGNLLSSKDNVQVESGAVMNFWSAAAFGMGQNNFNAFTYPRHADLAAADIPA